MHLAKLVSAVRVKIGFILVGGVNNWKGLGGGGFQVGIRAQFLVWVEGPGRGSLWEHLRSSVLSIWAFLCLFQWRSPPPPPPDMREQVQMWWLAPRRGKLACLTLPLQGVSSYRKDESQQKPRCHLRASKWGQERHFCIWSHSFRHKWKQRNSGSVVGTLLPGEMKGLPFRATPPAANAVHL